MILARSLLHAALIGFILPGIGQSQEPSAAEKAAGFVSMFNGTDLSGWKYLGKGKGPFSVKDGAIHYKGGGGWLCWTEKEFPDFELRCEFKLIKKGGDGGIFFRASQDSLGGADWPKQRYELQVKDYASRPASGTCPTSSTRRKLPKSARSSANGKRTA